MFLKKNLYPKRVLCGRTQGSDYSPHRSITNPDAGVGQILENVQAIETKTPLQHTVDFSKGY